jgi:hypothetical protein
MSSASYAFREVASGFFMNAQIESIIVLESKESLESTLSNFNIPNLEAVDKFDFSKEFLVLIVASPCPNPGYSIVVETVDFMNGEVNVKYKTERGPDGVMYAQVISYPWLLVAAERRI